MVLRIACKRPVILHTIDIAIRPVPVCVWITKKSRVTTAAKLHVGSCPVIEIFEYGGGVIKKESTTKRDSTKDKDAEEPRDGTDVLR